MMRIKNINENIDGLYQQGLCHIIVMILDRGYKFLFSEILEIIIIILL